MRLQNDEIGVVVLEESTIDAIRWVHGGRDIEMEIDWCGQKEFADEIDFNNTRSMLVFEFAHDLMVDVRYVDPNRIGPMDTSSYSIQRDDDEWRVRLDFKFQPQGLIELCCTKVEFVVNELSAA